MERFRWDRVLWLLVSLLAVFFMSGCAHKGVMKEAQMDTPEHHYLVGSNLLEKGDVDGALREFERAKALSPKFSPAYVGTGLVMAEKGNFDEAFAAMDQAEDFAKTDSHKVLYHTGMIRIYTKSGQEKWLKEAESHFKKASKIDSMDPAPCYFMAVAYKKAGDYENASFLFRKVIDLDREYVQQADVGWESVQRILRAMPGTKVGRDIAKLEKITRADVAALFVEEMKLDKVFMKHNVPLKKDQRDSAPNDYSAHVLKADIEAVNALNIKGLEIIGHRFDPDAQIARANFAMMIEDILVKVTREDDLPTRYIGSASPFKDVDDSYYAKNAIMTATTRGIMKADLYGYFKGDEAVSGADALLIIRRLNEALRY